MLKFRTRIAVMLLCVVTAFLLPACSPDTQGKTIRCDIASPIINLDPQYATDSSAIMIILNTCEGLLVSSPDGAISPGIAKSYDISADRLTYTFHLREDAVWAGSELTPVTAADFVFAFRRIFNSSSPSPYAEDYICIKNAENVLSGLYPAQSLGVTAKDDNTLVITLERENELFPELLAASAAMPCNIQAYENARGRYGLGLEFINSNGAFRVSRWTDTQITLSRNTAYTSGTDIPAGDFIIYIGREDAAGRFMDGATDIAELPYNLVPEAINSGASVETAQKTTWCIAFNQNSATWGNPLLRQALASAIDYDGFSLKLEDNYTVARNLVSPAAMLGGKPFFSYSDGKPSVTYDPANALRIFQMGLATLEYESSPRATLLVPDTGSHRLNMGLIQQYWQDNLSVYVNIQPVPASELEKRFASGDYELILVPFSPAGPKVETLLSVFTTGSMQNRFGYKSQLYDQLFSSAAKQATTERIAAALIQVEKAVLTDAVVIPIYYETTYYAAAKGVSGIEIQPFGNQVNFKHAVKS